MHRLDFGFYSHPSEFGGNGVRTHVNSKEKSPLPEKFSSEEDRTHDVASSRTASPVHYQRAIPAVVRLPLARGFFRVSHVSDLKTGTPMATLLGAWRCRVSAGTGWPGVSML